MLSANGSYEAASMSASILIAPLLRTDGCADDGEQRMKMGGRGMSVFFLSRFLLWDEKWEDRWRERERRDS